MLLLSLNVYMLRERVCVYMYASVCISKIYMHLRRCFEPDTKANTSVRCLVHGTLITERERERESTCMHLCISKIYMYVRRWLETDTKTNTNVRCLVHGTLITEREGGRGGGSRGGGGGSCKTQRLFKHAKSELKLNRSSSFQALSRQRCVWTLIWNISDTNSFVCFFLLPFGPSGTSLR